METKSRKIHYGFFIVAGIFLQYLLAAGIIFGASGQFIVPVTKSLGIGQGQFSFYMTIQQVAMALCTMAAPKLLEKFRFKPLNVTGTILASVGLGMMAFAKGIMVFYVGGALIGIGLTFLTFLTPGTLIPRWFNQKLGTMLAVAGSALALGGIIFNPVIAGLLNSAPKLGFSEAWRSSYLILAVLVFIVCFPVAVFVYKDSPESVGMKPYGEREIQEGAGSAAAKTGVSKAVAVKSLSFVFLVLMAVTWNLATPIYTYFPAYASTNGASTSITGIISSVVMLGSVVGGFIVGAINDRRGGHIGGLWCGICGVAGMLLMLIFKNSVVFLLAGGVLFGLYYAIANVELPAMVQKLYGTRDYDRIFPVASSVMPWAGAVSFSLWGFIYDGTGSYVVMMISGIILCALTALCGLLAVSAAKKLPQESDAA